MMLNDATAGEARCWNDISVNKCCLISESRIINAFMPGAAI